ncbi:hypothetical protein K2173_010343 [Erythroxylum novogranatense]|uniref:Late embryogenesis abundant protein LEA-2 subgroup domain-containing protein n=1 Tax=Erythroxylum novogranatense TaxID=1862640 RepID=A0AAV8TDV5_9ROSI|nr:hypothetical protein K2173_010343 [Erythroxylum novogranatense]
MKQGQETSSKCFVYILVGVVLVSAAALVFALVFMKPKTPDVELSMVSVNNLSYGYSTSPSFSMKLAAELTIKNSNFGLFKFKNSSLSFLYGGNITVGRAELRSGRVKSRKTKRVNVLVVARSQELLSDSQNLGSDINSGMLKLSSYAELKGEVHLVRGLENRRTPVLNCTMIVRFASLYVEDLLCN